MQFFFATANKTITTAHFAEELGICQVWLRVGNTFKHFSVKEKRN